MSSRRKKRAAPDDGKRLEEKSGEENVNGDNDELMAAVVRVKEEPQTEAMAASLRQRFAEQLAALRPLATAPLRQPSQPRSRFLHLTAKPRCSDALLLHPCGALVALQGLSASCYVFQHLNLTRSLPLAFHSFITTALSTAPSAASASSSSPSSSSQSRHPPSLELSSDSAIDLLLEELNPREVSGEARRRAVSHGFTEGHPLAQDQLLLETVLPSLRTVQESGFHDACALVAACWSPPASLFGPTAESLLLLLTRGHRLHLLQPPFRYSSRQKWQQLDGFSRSITLCLASLIIPLSSSPSSLASSSFSSLSPSPERALEIATAASARSLAWLPLHPRAAIDAPVLAVGLPRCQVAIISVKSTGCTLLSLIASSLSGLFVSPGVLAMPYPESHQRQKVQQRKADEAEHHHLQQQQERDPRNTNLVDEDANLDEDGSRFDPVESLCCSPNGRFLAASMYSRRLVALQLQEDSGEYGNPVSLENHHHCAVLAMCFDPSSSFLARANLRSHLTLHDTTNNTWQAMSRSFCHEAAEIVSLTWPSPSQLLSAAVDGSVRLWDRHTLQPLAHLPPPSPSDLSAPGNLARRFAPQLRGTCVSPNGIFLVQLFRFPGVPRGHSGQKNAVGLRQLPLVSWQLLLANWAMRAPLQPADSYWDLLELARLSPCPLLLGSSSYRDVSRPLPLLRLALVLLECSLTESWWQIDHYAQHLSPLEIPAAIADLRNAALLSLLLHSPDDILQLPGLNLDSLISWLQALSTPLSQQLLASLAPPHQQPREEHCPVCGVQISAAAARCSNSHPIHRCLLSFRLLHPNAEVCCCLSNTSHLVAIEFQGRSCPLCMLPLHPVTAPSLFVGCS